MCLDRLLTSTYPVFEKKLLNSAAVMVDRELDIWLGFSAFSTLSLQLGSISDLRSL